MSELRRGSLLYNIQRDSVYLVLTGTFGKDCYDYDFDNIVSFRQCSIVSQYSSVGRWTLPNEINEYLKTDRGEILMNVIVR